MNILWFLFLWFGFHATLFVARSNVVIVTLISIPTVSLEIVPTYLERERDRDSANKTTVTEVPCQVGHSSRVKRYIVVLWHRIHS